MRYSVRMLKAPAFVLSVSAYEGRTAEELLAAERPSERPPLGGALVDASYAATQPLILRRLRELHIPYAIAPESSRFADSGYLTVTSVADLPYAPTAPLGRSPSQLETARLVKGSLTYQATHHADWYLTPALPFTRPLGADADTYKRLHHLVNEFVGKDVPNKPVIAYACPSYKVLRSPYAVFSQLVDVDIAAIYVQSQSLNSRHDSVEKLVAFVNFLRCAGEYGLPVIAGRQGSFGLILCALGFDAFESGLAHRESFDLAALTRPRKPDSSGKTRGGRARRVYLQPLLTTVSEKEARVILDNPTLRSRFVCDRGRCRFVAEGQINYHKEHFFHVREAEMLALQASRSREMRVEVVLRWLEAAVENAGHVNAVLRRSGHPAVAFDHLTRWQAVVARVTGKRGWRRAS